MKRLNIYLLIPILLFSLTHLSSQSNKFGLNASIGIGQPLFDPIGFIAAVHPHYKISNVIYIEGLLSFSPTNRTPVTFLGGRYNESSVILINVCTGIRLNLTNSQNKNHFYLNLLPGLYYGGVEPGKNGVVIESGWQGTASLTLYYQNKYFLVGVGAEGDNILLLRFGTSLIRNQ